MTRLLPVAAAVVVLLFSGLVHGLWIDRWGLGQDLTEAAARLDRLPLQLGEWEGTDLPMKNRQSGGLTGSVTRRYVHRPSGKVVTMFLACGRSQEVAIHTPDVCYAASGFKMLETKREFTLPPESARPGSSFYTDRMQRTRGADQTQLRIFWSWYIDGKWQVTENPRSTFGRRSVMYKLYVLREADAAPATTVAELNTDPCVELMNCLLPAFEEKVLPSS